MLDGHVLVLNRVFQAVQITSVRRALTLLYKGQVRAVDAEYRTYDFENWSDIPVQPNDHYVRTPSRNILIPHVVQLLSFDRLPRQEVKFSRGNIYLRDVLDFFPFVDESIDDDAVLLLVQSAIFSAHRHQLGVCAALGDAAFFEHENLIRFTNRRETMGDDERRASAHQSVQAVLNH